MHILLVEDSKDDAALLADFFAEEKDAPQIHWVTDGREALDYVSKQGAYQHSETPDVILLDLAMPRMSGFETLTELKKLAACATIPVIVITTSYNPIDEINCRRLGADGFYSKPSNLQGYEELIQTLIKQDFPRLARAS